MNGVLKDFDRDNFFVWKNYWKNNYIGKINKIKLGSHQIRSECNLFFIV